MKIGGFVGEAACQGEISEFVPLLDFGEKTHVGKATGFGLGSYAVESAR
jgi:CRISPR/Cas system endoribonuclease Cas6 (RAMP superfamily)